MSLNNAARQNYLQIREQQQLNRERAREAESVDRRKQELLQRQKAAYEHVQSNGYGGVNPRPAAPSSVSGSICATDDVEIKVFIRECDGDQAKYFTFKESEAARPGPTGRRPAPTEKPPNTAARDKSAPALAGGNTDVNPPPHQPQRGVVPNYLVRRKAELAAEKAAMQREVERQQETAKYPPGHRPVTDEERRDTLNGLATRRQELELEMHKLPIRFDTQAIKMKRKKIEDELGEIEEAERKFNSKRPLFVPIG